MSKRYIVTTGSEVPTGRWTERPNLMDYREAATYAARIVESETGITPITVRDTTFKAVQRVSDNSVVLGNHGAFHDPEHIRIATAIRDAIEAKQKVTGARR